MKLLIASGADASELGLERGPRGDLPGTTGAVRFGIRASRNQSRETGTSAQEASKSAPP